MTITSTQREFHDVVNPASEKGKIRTSSTKTKFDLAAWLRPNSINKAYKMLDDSFSFTSVTSVNSYLDHSNDKSMELNVQRSIDTTQSLEQILRRDHVHQEKQEWSEEKNGSTDGWRFQGKQRLKNDLK
jgi:hypothetical protein